MRLTEGDGVEEDDDKDVVVEPPMLVVFIHGGKAEPGVEEEGLTGSEMGAEPRERTGGGSGREMFGIIPAGGKGRE